MAVATDTISKPQRAARREFNFGLFVEEHITRTWYLTLWLLFLTVLSVIIALRQLQAASGTTTFVVVAWMAGLLAVIVGELRRKHSAVSRWLKSSLFSSITNSLITLVLLLGIVAAVRGIWDYAVVRATFDPAFTAPEFRTEDRGAVWGVIRGAWKLLTTGTLDLQYMPRVYMALWFVVGMSVISLFVYNERFRKPLKAIRPIVTVIWLLSPLVLFIVLAGLKSPERLISVQTLLGGEIAILAIYGLLYWQRVIKFSLPGFAVWALAWPALYVAWQGVASSGAFPTINVNTWGGLLFTLIISVFAIVASFPLGLALALGRRSEIRGIPAWITWPLAIALTIWAFATTSQQLIDEARNTIEKVLTFWPLLILLVAYLFQRMFKGNVVAAASTVYIEVIRGVPLITVLFTAIIMAPLFFPKGVAVQNAWAVMVAFTLFTAAYLAENVRGGLQAIPKGQYEAADAIGLNTLQKMRFIILPQALRAVIPAIVGLFIGVFKDSSLVAVVGLFDLLGITNSIVGNPQWLGLRRELYIFTAIIYFVGSFAMSSYSRRLETRLGVGER